MGDNAIKSAGIGPGDEIHGFRAVKTTPIAAMSAEAVEFKHLKTGTRLLHLAAADRENLFAVAFRTPPPDDTGLPHIIEHSVLCGSERFPVKDPFVELLKTSLATFLNAFTYPDRTVYPCSSMNRKDFHNLVRVYCDAVFFPRLSEEHFRQEGHHLEFLPDGRLTMKGVVYNEMRGVYSDPEGILDRHIQQNLFAGNAYGRDYGGDPKAIADLTYADYLAFHKRYYHPANAWIFTYGDVAVGETLALLDREYLSRFEPIKVDTTIEPLAAWNAPKRMTFPYPLDAEDSERNKAEVSIAFATNDGRDGLATLAMHVVDSYLLDNAASPLRKALIDSKLGEELGSSGYASHQRDTFFVVGLKGTEADRTERIEELCLKTIAAEVERGFDDGKVKAALHQLELASREIKQQYPLRLMERAFSAWLYDSDPLSHLLVAERLDELGRAMAADPRYLENLAGKWLVENRHRLTVTMVPDKEYVARNDAEFAKEMADRLAKMNPAERGEVGRIAGELERSQSEPNSPEALATLPKLSLGDVSPEPTLIPREIAPAGGWDVLSVPLYAAGVGYLQLSLDIHGLDDNLLDALPLFCEALCKTGAAGLDYAEMAERESAVTGALDFSAGMAHRIDGADKSRLRISAWLKALDSNWEKALSLLEDRLFKADFSDRERLKDIILQARIGWRGQVAPAGNAYAALYASRGLSPALALSERLSGCTQGRFVDRLAANVDNELPRLIETFHAIREQALAIGRLTACQITESPNREKTRAWLEATAPRFARRAAGTPDYRRANGASAVGLAAPTDIAFAAKALPAPPFAHPDAPALLLLGTQLSYGFLWNEVRVKGGAYGAKAHYDGARGAFTLSSYRDPNIMPTFAVYDRLPGYVKTEMDLSPAGLEQAVIGTVKTLDQPVRPPTAAAAAMSRHLGGETDDFMRRFRSRLLGLTADDVRRAAGNVLSGVGTAPRCALASREKLQGENAKAGGGAELAIESLWEGQA